MAMYMKGRRKFMCGDCGEIRFLYPNEVRYGSYIKSKQVRCRKCGSTFIDPVTAGAIAETHGVASAAGVAVNKTGLLPTQAKRRGHVDGGTSALPTPITAADVKRKARRKPSPPTPQGDAG